MKNRIWVFRFMVGLLITTGLFSIGYSVGSNKECPDCNCPRIEYRPCPDCVCKPYEYPFVDIINTVAESHEYNKTGYNCNNYTIDLVNMLNGEGYEAYYVYGDAWNFTDINKHAWTKLCLHIEATKGEILTPWDFEQNYRVIEVNPEWSLKYLNNEVS